MTETNPKIGFWKFPVTLKFVVFWVFLLSLYSFWRALDIFIIDHAISVNNVVGGFVYFYLAIGLVDRSNGSRILTSIVMGVDALVHFVFLNLLFLEIFDPGYIVYYSVRYPVSQGQSLAYQILNMMFNAIIVYILLRPSTKALFMRTPPQPTPPAEPTPQETV